MIKTVMIATLLTASACAFTVLEAQARASCGAQAQSIKAGQKHALSLQTERDALLEEVEAAGDEWEAAEQSRLFGDTEATKADIAKEDYDALKIELVALEDDLQGQVSDLNAAVAAYNRRCATKQAG